MIVETKLWQFGNLLGIELPKEMTDRLNLSTDDSVLLVETEDGILISHNTPALARATEAGERIATRYQNAMRELAG